MRAVNVVALEALVRWREDLYFNTRFFLVGDGGPQPRDFGIFWKSWIDGAYDESFHFIGCSASCALLISWMQAG